MAAVVAALVVVSVAVVVAAVGGGSDSVSLQSWRFSDGGAAGESSHRPHRKSRSTSRAWPSRSPSPSGSTSTEASPSQDEESESSPTAQDGSTAPEPAPAESTPAVIRGSCVGDGEDPGAPDPWGGCWPGPQNTGYPKGLPGDTRKAVTLSNYSGATTITKCGVTIDSKIVKGDLLITAGNGTHSASTPCVTIKNSLVKGTIHTDSLKQGPVVVRDTEVDAPADSYWASIGFYNMFTYRVNSHGGQGTIKCQGYCESYDSWVHGMDLNRDYHYNAFGSNGIEAADATFVISHGYADCGGFDSRTSNVGSDAGCSADIGFYGDFAPIRNITITKTYFAPSRPTSEFGRSTQPGYCLNPGYYPGKPYPNPSNMVVKDNVFGRGANGKCGEYGASNTWLKGSDNVWSGNAYDNLKTLKAA